MTGPWRQGGVGMFWRENAADIAACVRRQAELAKEYGRSGLETGFDKMVGSAEVPRLACKRSLLA
eukprot:1150275-Pelagomonas_calceolata.AAC.5